MNTFKTYPLVLLIGLSAAGILSAHAGQPLDTQDPGDRVDVEISVLRGPVKSSIVKPILPLPSNDAETYKDVRVFAASVR